MSWEEWRHHSTKPGRRREEEGKEGEQEEQQEEQQQEEGGEGGSTILSQGVSLPTDTVLPGGTLLPPNTVLPKIEHCSGGTPVSIFFGGGEGVSGPNESKRKKKKLGCRVLFFLSPCLYLITGMKRVVTILLFGS